ncbi:MAG: hypothetical protein HOD92_02500 [Deltaproteobacteria bacterium]|nr:hypothetical protein [Deltaproteobacteria bacterium]MBT4527340.1 hypothetical protein [Deltaproteobacteria bacterium]
MYDVSVTSQDDVIYIEQPSIDDQNESVMLHPEQIDLVVRWLKEAKNEIIKKRKKQDLPMRKKMSHKNQSYIS